MNDWGNTWGDAQPGDIAFRNIKRVSLVLGRSQSAASNWLTFRLLDLETGQVELLEAHGSWQLNALWERET